MSFPYPLPPLDLAAPFDRHRAAVQPGWVDGNGHMNVGYYLVAFDHATDTISEQLGVDWRYVEHRIGRIFIVEAHVTYEHELIAGDPLRITTLVLDHDDKRAHLFHAMYHAGRGFLAATNELMMLHVGFETRRAAPWAEETRARLAALAAAHRALPRPPQAGHVIGLKRR
ncbi:MAG TPA: thioesterase family protein [Stellaceae bacterium]|nr:thioesterase family protein [Stellaceae bacterium]